MKVEELLNSIGCHGGNVSIVAAKNMGDTHEVAQQVSMSGAKARRFLKKLNAKSTRVEQPNTADANESRVQTWELWKELCKSTTDNDPSPRVVNLRKQVWSTFDKLFSLMTLTTTTEEQRNLFQVVLVEFTTSVTRAWGESNITHYMVN